MADRNITEKECQLLKQVSDFFDIEDRAVRERQIRYWRKLKHYWNTLQNIYYSEVAHDWRIWPTQQNADDNADQAYYDKPVNVFRAYLESIIAALSVTVPAIKCYPDDADNPQDLDTAKAGDRIAALIFKHNDAPLLWLHALYITATEGMIAAYSYTKEDEKYGTYEEKQFEDVTSETYLCPNCGTNLGDNIFTNREKDEFAPDSEDVEIQDLIQNEHEVLCPQCGALLDPALQKSPLIVTRLVGVNTKPKSRQCIEVYGGLYVKVPNYAMQQKDMPYLRFSYETNYVEAIERYEFLRDKLDNKPKVGPSAQGLYDPYEAWGRLSTQYLGEYPINNVTINNYWFRPSAFNVLKEDECKYLKEKFPNGCKFVKVNDVPAEACNESLDDCWTISYNPLSDYLHYEPIGGLLTSIQDITNDLVSLTLQTIEHGIPQTFADPSVLNFDQYRQTETTPGAVYPATPRAGKTLGDGFHEVKTATLSGEILPFGQSVQSMGQLVSGALPSLFGGANAQGSETASEYAMSRAQALQRLQTVWRMLTFWWKNIFGKVIPGYIKDVVEDEHFVEADERGNFINVFIRKSELNGKLGAVELESADQLPIAWAQKKDVIMELVKLQDPIILQMLGSPENIWMIRDIIGLSELKIPGEAERQAELEEIQQLVNSEPMVIPPAIDPMMLNQMMANGPVPPEIMQQAQPQELPSVQVDPLLDNHQLRFEVDKNWLISDAGRLAKVENPPSYKNVLLHAQMHMQQMQMQMMQAQMMAAGPGQGAEPGKPNSGEKPPSAPIQGEKDAQRFTAGA